ncbi:EpsD family peptidyl-prolyl cis-trans isomerase [Janthinobacterium agaricidamnosum]|nr:EpsD family peptidyl-prolyl cis-trans isomerase [Janthinobacterium agaricidamnosum]
MSSQRVLCAGLVLLAAVGLSACGDKEKKSGQALASVNGKEITVLQLNEELQRSGVQAAQQEAASKQLLEALIDRQLLENEASKDKTDRDPKVMQAIERAKSLIVAQAYMQKRIGNVAKPTEAEVEDYFTKHPEFFTQRKQFDMKELVIASADMNDELKKAMDGAKSLEEVAVWLDAHQLKYVRTQLSRTSADLAPELSAKLLAMPKGQLFIIREGDRSLLISIADIKDSPVTLAVASQQIQQFLFNKKNKDAADAELARLRATAKIEYLNKGAPASASAAASAAAPAAAPAPAPAPAAESSSPVSAAHERGVAGLK